jgi:uncharacterized membrane protein YeaQ/YmgE (transglycosylase-associated protein family)
MDGPDSAVAAFFGVAIVVALVCGMISASIAGKKGLSAGGYFFLGFILGVIGIIIAAVAQPAFRASPPPSPPGWYPDPWQQAWFRWYDGYQWSWQTSNGDG